MKPEWVVGAHDLVWQGIMVLFYFFVCNRDMKPAAKVVQDLWLPYKAGDDVLSDGPIPPRNMASLVQ